MKKLIVLGIISALAITCVGFAYATPGETMPYKHLPGNVQEEFLSPEMLDDGTIVYRTDEFEATVLEDREPAAVAEQSDDLAFVTIEAVSLPDDVEEEFLDPVEIADGVYEYRDADGNLVATMYEYESMEALQAAQDRAAKKTIYNIDMDVDARSEAYGSENIDISNKVTIVYDIDFARKTPSYLGQYVEKDGKVSWFSPGSSNGFYKSINIVGNAPISVAIKNQGNKDNIYTGTVTVSPA